MNKSVVKINNIIIQFEIALQCLQNELMILNKYYNFHDPGEICYEKEKEKEKMLDRLSLCKTN